MGYIVNGYKFHTLAHGDDRVTNNSGVCVKGSCYNEEESDYYGELEEVIEVDYHSMLGTCMVVLLKCRWFDLVQGVKVNVKHKLVDVKYRSRGCIYDPFILAHQAQQAYYATYPSMTKDLKDWWAVVKDFFQENERLECTTGTTEDIQPVSLVREEIQEVQTALVTDVMNEDGEEEEFEDSDDDSSDDIDLYSSNHSSDDDG
ncbi:transposon, En/Spm-like, transposase-associated domain protein [Tanacetum coccineum]